MEDMGAGKNNKSVKKNEDGWIVSDKCWLL